MKKLTRVTVAGTALMLVMTAFLIVTPPLAAFGAINLNSSKSNIYRVGNNTYISIDINVPYAPMAVAGDNNAYVVWWTNKSGNWEVMFRGSTDGGATFGDKINLSNSPDTDSQNADIVAIANKVFVSWWETNPITGSSESVLRVSTDAGQTFGPVLNLGSNGTISTTTSNTATAAEVEAVPELSLPSPDTNATGGGEATNETAGIDTQVRVNDPGVPKSTTTTTEQGEPVPDIGSEEGGGAESDPSIAIDQKGVK